jgi:DNA-binding GntR family transcriptional regulator
VTATALTLTAAPLTIDRVLIIDHRFQIMQRPARQEIGAAGKSDGRRCCVMAKSKLPLRPVAKNTVLDQIYRQIRELILDGEIEPGQTVTIQSLADAFEVSAMPVREALHRLTAERALTVVAGRSVGIPPLTRARLDDLTRVRLEIEVRAAEWAAGKMGAGELARLDRLIQRMADAATARDRKRYVPANREFHFAIYRAAGSETLLAVIETLWLQISPYFDLLHARGNWQSANRCHQELRDALAADDAPAAGAALRADIGGAAEVLAELLETGAGSGT